MGTNACNFCGSTFEDCDCDTENNQYRINHKTNARIKDYFKTRVGNEMRPFVDIATKEYNDAHPNEKINPNDPKVPEYKRTQIMARAMQLFIKSKAPIVAKV